MTDHPLPRRRKSVPPRRVLLLGASALALAGCQEEVTDVVSFSSPDACASAGTDRAACEAAFAEAAAEHAETAPRYDARAVCEEQHGEGNCAVEERPGGGSVFLPLMAGFMLGQALSGARARPLVQGPRGGFSTTDGRVTTGALGARGQVRAGAFNASPASTRTAPALTRSTVARTGGFGAARTGGGFGG